LLAPVALLYLLRPGVKSPGLFSPYNDAAGGDDEGILHETAVAYHLPRTIKRSTFQKADKLKC
jgi:hypothetical protein